MIQYEIAVTIDGTNSIMTDVIYYTELSYMHNLQLCSLLNQLIIDYLAVAISC
jgi:hypothetical protein